MTGARKPILGLTACATALLVALLVLAAPALAGAPAVSLVHVSDDPLAASGDGAQHNTELESASATDGTKIVGVYQVGRFNSGGSASAAGWGTSADGGQTWSSGLLPGITTSTPAPGTHPRVVDMNTAYDAKNGLWLIGSIPVDCSSSTSCSEAAAVVSTSSDGTTWNLPTTVRSTGQPDKQWTVCDNHPASAHYGTCYMAYTDDVVGSGAVEVTSSSDAAHTTWSAPVATGIDGGYNVQPVVLADGTLVVVASDLGSGTLITQLYAVRSTDGGNTWSTPVTIDAVSGHHVTALRDFIKPSVAVDSGGRIWVTWADCRYRTSCASSDVVTSTSTDGQTWTATSRVPLDATSSTTDHVIPIMAADPSSGTVGIKYDEVTPAGCTGSTTNTCTVRSAFTSTTDGGQHWASRVYLAAGTSALNLAQASSGRMPGDYEGLVYAGGKAVSLLPVTGTRVSTTFAMSMYAASVAADQAPTAAFTSSCTGLGCALDGSGSADTDGSIASYAWDFGDGSTGSGATPSHTYAAGGDYTVQLTVTDDAGRTASVSHVVHADAPPQAAFTSSCSGVGCSFDSSGSSDADGTIAAYDWNFGDGSTHATTASPPHTYATKGTYTVTLKVTDDAGLTDTVSHTVTVDKPPVAAFTSSCTGLGCGLDGTSSSDPDGTVASYDWNFGDGSPHASGAKPSYTYAAKGTYTVTLTVTDDGGQTGTVSHTVTVDKPPVAAFTSSCTGLSCTLDGSASTDSDGTVAAYAWDFGDGGTGTGAKPSHTYAAKGTYTVRLTVTDDGGQTDTVTHTVVVDRPPTAAFAIGCSELSCEMDGNASADTDGTVVAYDWDYGDGSAHGSGAMPSHVYAARGTYTVRLTATDDAGQTGTLTRTITVDRSPTAAFSVRCAARTCTVDGSASADPDGSIASYTWDFGDGTTAAGASATHRYARDGTFTIRLTVIDDAGAPGNATQDAALADRAPVASFAAHCAAHACTLDAGASSDPDGSIAAYAWDFGDGTKGAGPAPAHTFATAGRYAVRLTVTDDDGTQTSTTQVLAVADPPVRCKVVKRTARRATLRCPLKAKVPRGTRASVKLGAKTLGRGTASGRVATVTLPPAALQRTGLTLIVRPRSGRPQNVVITSG